MWHLYYVRKSSSGLGSTPDYTGRTSSAPETPLADGDWASCPLFKNLSPTVDLSGLRLCPLCLAAEPTPDVTQNQR